MQQSVFIPKMNSWDSRWDWISTETFHDEMTEGDVHRSQAYIRHLMQIMQKTINTWNDFASVLKDADAGKTIDPMKIQLYCKTVSDFCLILKPVYLELKDG